MRRIERPPRGLSFITRGNSVVGIFWVDGRRHYHGLGTFEPYTTTSTGRLRTKNQISQAINRAWDMKREELELALPPAFAKRTISQTFADAIAQARRKGRAKGTIRTMELCRDYYLADVGDHPVEVELANGKRGFPAGKAERFIDGLRARKLGPLRINTYLTRLTSALRHDLRGGHVDRLPYIDHVKTERKRVTPPTLAHLRMVWARLNVDAEAETYADLRHYNRLHRLLFLLILGTGMRPMEAHAIERKHIDLKNRAILLTVTKNRDPRVCRIPVFLRDALEVHLDASPGRRYLFQHPDEPQKQAWYSPGAMTHAFGKIMSRLGIRGAFKPLYGYRQLFTSVGLNDVGVAAIAIQHQMGHANISTTDRHYLAGMQDAQLRAVDEMEAQFFSTVFSTASDEKSDEELHSN